MLDPSLQAIVDDARALPTSELFHLYVSLAGQAPQSAHVAALAIREQARAGALGPETAPVLAACIAEAPDEQALIHLAKAAAAVGRAAAEAAPPLAERVAALHVTDDVEYWILDGCAWSLAFLGGPDAARALAALAAERPSRAVRSDSVYKGEMSRAEREERFSKTLAGCAEMVAGPDPGPWREKKTKLTPKKAVRSAGKSSVVGVRLR